MGDPFSAATGALTVVDVCVRVGKYLNNVTKAAKSIDEEVQTLDREINTFSTTYGTLKSLCDGGLANPRTKSHAPSGVVDPCSTLWTRAADLVKEGQLIVEKLEDSLRAVIGKDINVKPIDDVRKAIKIVAKKDDYAKLRTRFTTVNLELSLMMTAIELTSNSLFRSSTISSLEQLPSKLSRELQECMVRLKTQIERLDHDDADLEPTLLSAKAAVNFASLNAHYYVQKPDTSIWTGRQNHLDSVRDGLLKTVIDGIQRRFVVCGISGAGKTQFCCKFAQAFRESFWGVFWIDASSEQNAKESWKRIAKIGGKDANDEAGKFWLTNLQSPWLLIVDSADNSEDSIAAQFPAGDRGCILITTRNPRLKINATSGSLTLDKLEESESTELLRKASNHLPWDAPAKASASSISKHLGYLPLALIHAGRAILHQLCTLQGYITFFDKALDEVRKKGSQLVPMGDEDDGMGAFTTFAIIYAGLEAQASRPHAQSQTCSDAIELINMFAFMHNTDINLDILIKPARNITQAQSVSATTEPPISSRKTIRRRLEDYATALYIRHLRPKANLPHILQVTRQNPFDEPRARKAIGLLVRMSLLAESSETGSYSIHPLVHIWIRKWLSLSAQALWCGVAGDVLANAIKIPPMKDDAGDQEFYVRLLPHLERVSVNKQEIASEIWRNCQEAGWIRSLLGLRPPPSFTTGDALNAAKFSRVYMECSKFSDAELLQRRVRDFVVQNMGRNSQFAVPISMALAATLWHMGRAGEAQELQEEALKICSATFGASHAQTLKVKDALGETYWQRGWLKEAKALHEVAILGMEGNPDMRKDQLKAMTHLGHVYEWYTEFDKAKELHEKASEGLSQDFGDNDFDTMTAKDSLAMTLLQIGGIEAIVQAQHLMQDIYDRRLRRFGEEHIYTLWAACNLGRTLTARGPLEHNHEFLERAKRIFNDGLEICRRNLGLNHIGTLMGRTYLTNVLVAEGQYEEAEKEYKDIAECQKALPGARAGTHRDRLVTLQLLVRCYEVQGQLSEAIEVCTTIVQEIDGLGGQKHPWRIQMAAKRNDLKSRFSQASSKESAARVEYVPR